MIPSLKYVHNQLPMLPVPFDPIHLRNGANSPTPHYPSADTSEELKLEGKEEEKEGKEEVIQYLGLKAVPCYSPVLGVGSGSLRKGCRDVRSDLSQKSSFLKHYTLNPCTSSIQDKIYLFNCSFLFSFFFFIIIINILGSVGVFSSRQKAAGEQVEGQP